VNRTADRRSEWTGGQDGGDGYAGGDDGTTHCGNGALKGATATLGGASTLDAHLPRHGRSVEDEGARNHRASPARTLVGGDSGARRSPARKRRG
jgi:hypothetical protein